MSKPNKTESLNGESTVEGLLRKIEAKSREDDYLFRGEPAHYQESPYHGKVSSNLYRVFLEPDGSDVLAALLETLANSLSHLTAPGQENDRKIAVELLDIEEFQTVLLYAAKRFSRKKGDDADILAEIQHYGGRTNLIDFTADYLIALFMACDGSPSKDGRIILQKKEPIESYIEPPYEPMHRVIAQKSVFVQHPKGFIEPNEKDVIDVPASLKKPMLEHLERYHGISTQTIYNDIHGFIRHQRLNAELYKEIARGLTCKQQGDAENGDTNATRAL